MGDMDNDLVMESTTDTPEQIEAGLSITLADDDAGVQAGAADAEETSEVGPAADGGEEAPAASAGSEDADATEGDESPVVVTPHQTQRAEAPKAGRPQRKTVDGAAAAARRRATADMKVLQAENDALRRRLEALATGQPATSSTPAAAPVVTARAVQPVDPTTVPDTHPKVATVVSKLTALVRPKQEDFADYEEFEAKKEEYLIAKARLEARLDIVREDVAREETAILEEANRAAAQTAQSFQQSVEAARTRYADYDDVMAAATEADLQLPREFVPVISESPVGGDIVYYLSKNPTELTRISALSPHRAAAEIGKIEDRITASLTRPGSRPTTPARPAARTTKAPEPPSVTLGDLGANVRGAKDLNDPTLTLSEYNRLRDQMDVASGRRRA